MKGKSYLGKTWTYRCRFCRKEVLGKDLITLFHWKTGDYNYTQENVCESCFEEIKKNNVIKVCKCGDLWYGEKMDCEEERVLE